MIVLRSAATLLLIVNTFLYTSNGVEAYRHHSFNVKPTDNSPPVSKYTPTGTLDGEKAVYFGHRGDRVLMPEHSIGSYHIAAVLGAEYVEPDLVLTKDGVPVCMHDPDLSSTTDVASRPEFAKKRRNLTAWMYGENKTISNDWFVIDFTLAELKTLKLKQRPVGIRPLYFDQIFSVPTFQEYIDLVKQMSSKLNRTVGLVPELKHARFHNQIFGKPNYFENKVLDILEKNGFPRKGGEKAPLKKGFTNVVFQSFEKETCEFLRKETNFDVLALVDTDWKFFTPAGLKEVQKYATVVSPWKEIFDKAGPEGYIHSANVTVDQNALSKLGGWIPPSEYVKRVHDLGMRMVVYTFYDSREMKGSRSAELKRFFNMGVDGLFVENVGEAVEIRSHHYK